MKKKILYNHKAFLEKLMLIESESERQLAMKNYIFSLPASELSLFLKGQVQDIGNGVQELILNKSLNSTQKEGLIVDMDETIELLKTMKDDMTVKQRKAA